MKPQPFSPSQEKRLASHCIDRLGVKALTRGSKGFALTVLLVAMIGQQAATRGCHHNENIQSCLFWGWRSAIPSFVMIVILLLKHCWKKLRQWLETVSDTTTSVLSNVSSNPTLTRIRTSVNASSMRLLSLASKRASHFSSRERHLALSATEPFLSAQDTRKLSLADLTAVFRFAATLNQHSTNAESTKTSNRSFATFRPTLQNAFDAMESTVAFSRGIRTHIASRNNNASSFADMDALAFVAACRIFAEWRTMRLVPEGGGSQRYAMGMKLAHRDLLQNIAKMEVAIHRCMKQDEPNDSTTTTTTTTTATSSPTLRQLLQFEIDQKVHRKLPKLSDQSGANGLLWILRQIRYQARIFANFTQVPVAFPSSKAANVAAYHATYGEYHGFLTRQLFQASFDAAPEAHVILQCVGMMKNPAEEDVSRATTQSFSDSDTDSEGLEQEDTWIHFDTSEHFQEEDDDDDDIREGPLVNNNTLPAAVDDNPLAQFGSHLVNEWIKLTRFLDQCRGAPMLDPSRNAVVSRPLLMMRQDSDASASAATTSTFVDFMTPFLDDLDTLMRDFNMNDPTRV